MVVSRIIQKSCIVTDMPTQLFMYPLSGKSHLILSKCPGFYYSTDTDVNIWKEGERLYLRLIDFIFNNVVNKVCPLNQSKATLPWTLNISKGPGSFHDLQFTHYFQFSEKLFNSESYISVSK